jgi:hypothetical protein
VSIIDSIAAKYGNDYRRMATALDKALAEIDRLRLENANLRTENRHLRRLLADRDLRLLRRAHRDALLIGALHFAGGYTSKRQCATVGMGESRWCLARALLRRAHILKANRIVVETAQQYEDYITMAIHAIETTGDAGVLKRGSYRHRHRKYRK